MKYINILEVEKQACEAVPSFTQIHGHPTREDRNKLREEVMQALSVPDMTLFENSHGDFGLLGEVCGDAEYTRITKLVFIEQTKPAEYSEDVDEPATSRGGK